MDSLRPRTLRTSSELQPSTSRRVITVRWRLGRAAIAAWATSIVSLPTSRFSGSSDQRDGADVQAPRSVRRAGSGRRPPSRSRRRRVAAREENGSAAALALAARLRAVREDPEYPRLQRRAALEAPDPGEHAQPRLLDDVLGDGPVDTYIRATRSIDGPVFLDQGRERILVARAERGHELGLARGRQVRGARVLRLVDRIHLSRHATRRSTDRPPRGRRADDVGSTA